MLERVQVADVAQVYALWKKYADTANAGDMEGWIALWTDSAIRLSPGAPRRFGEAEILREMQPEFARGDTRKMIVQPEEVRILGDLAYSHGTFEVERATGQGGQVELWAGKFLGILEKQVDGSWKIAIECHNYTTPPE